MEELKKAEEAAEKYAIKTMKIISNGMFDNVGRAEGFIAGAKWDREQMMKEAVEGEIFDDYDKDTCEHHLTILSTVPSGYKDGDKVKIIVIHETDIR